MQKEAFKNGLISRIVLQGGNENGATTYPPFYDAANGALQTTPEEYQSYVNRVSGSAPAPAPAPTYTVPDPPTNVSAVGGNAQATVSFTPPANDGGSEITLYIVQSSPGGIVASGVSSPIIVPYLSNNTSYTFTVIATNSVGDSEASSASSSITTTTPTSSAPTITGMNALINSLIVTFTAPASFGTIANYEYSLDGGASFVPLSPVDAASPITISSLTPTTAYSVAIRAVNTDPATGDSSNIVSISTTTTKITQTFSTPISTTWVAPANVRYVQYLCVAGGGGGGAAYSRINVLGAVPVQSTAPASGYWIYNGTTTSNYTNGRMYNGAAVNPNYTTFSDPIRCTPSADLQPTGTAAASQKWYSTMELVYNLSGALPIVTNYGYPGYIVSSSLNNQVSGGGGGGAGGQVKATFSATGFYSVVPHQAYTVIVGDGGEGGVGALNSEAAGSKGGDSTFDVNVCTGGSGGQPSRVLTNSTNGYSNGGRGQTTTTNQIGGYGGTGVGGAGGQGLATTGGYGGAGGLVGPNFAGAYCYGGAGGVPSTVASGVTTPNIGKGGAGTGATLNSYASGIKGGTGVVVIIYYE
jgi:hypothetical protein